MMVVNQVVPIDWRRQELARELGRTAPRRTCLTRCLPPIWQRRFGTERAFRYASIRQAG
jgi:hypothetical protein